MPSNDIMENFARHSMLDKFLIPIHQQYSLDYKDGKGGGSRLPSFEQSASCPEENTSAAIS